MGHISPKGKSRYMFTAVPQQKDAIDKASLCLFRLYHLHNEWLQERLKVP